MYKLRPIVRRTLVTTNKGKSGLIELPYPDPVQHHLIPQHHHPHHQAHHYPIYGQNNVHYSDPYDMMETEAKKVRDFPENFFILIH